MPLSSSLRLSHITKNRDQLVADRRLKEFCIGSLRDDCARVSEEPAHHLESQPAV